MHGGGIAKQDIFRIVGTARFALKVQARIVRDGGSHVQTASAWGSTSWDPTGKARTKKPKYALVGTLTIPINDGAPMVQGLRDMRKEIKPMEGDEEVLEAIRGDEDVGADGEGVDLMVEEGREREDKEEVVDPQGVHQDEEAWRAFLKDAKRREVRTLVFAVPLASRKAPQVVEGVAKITTRVRALQVPILRVHTDRAKEFVGQTFRSFLRARGIYQTYTSGDEPTGNARTERAIGWLKQRARVLLRAAESGMERWPLAIRHAAEETLRSQLRNLGIPTTPMLRFGAKVLIKRKTWHRRGENWVNPMQPATAWGPANDMSISSKGYFLETAEGKFMRSTVVIQPQHRGDQIPERQHGGDQAEDLGDAEALLQEETVRPLIGAKRQAEVSDGRKNQAKNPISPRRRAR